MSLSHPGMSGLSSIAFCTDLGMPAITAFLNKTVCKGLELGWHPATADHLFLHFNRNSGSASSSLSVNVKVCMAPCGVGNLARIAFPTAVAKGAN